MKNQLIWERTGIREDTAKKNRVVLVCSALRLIPIGENAVRLRVATSSSFTENNVCFPSVVFYGKEAIEALQALDMKNKPRVIIEGFVQTEKKEKNGETKYFQDLVALKISYAKTRLETAFGVDGVGVAKAPASNEVLLTGEVVHTYRFPNGRYNITIRADHHGVYNFPSIFCSRTYADVCDRIKVGDKVLAACEVYTYNTDGRNTFPTRESIYAKDIQFAQ